MGASKMTRLAHRLLAFVPTMMLRSMPAAALFSGCYSGLEIEHGSTPLPREAFRIDASKAASEAFDVSHWIISESGVATRITGLSSTNDMRVDAELVLEVREDRSVLVLRSIAPWPAQHELTEEREVRPSPSSQPGELELLRILQEDVLPQLAPPDDAPADDESEFSTGGFD